MVHLPAMYKDVSLSTRFRSSRLCCRVPWGLEDQEICVKDAVIYTADLRLIFMFLSSLDEERKTCCVSYFLILLFLC